MSQEETMLTEPTNPENKNNHDGEKEKKALTKEERMAKKKARMERMATKKEERIAKRKARLAAKKVRIAERRAARKLERKNKKNDENTGQKDNDSSGKEGISTKGKAEEIAANIFKEEQRLIVEARKQARQKFMKDVRGQPALRKEVIQELRRNRQKQARRMLRQEKNRQRKQVGALEEQVSTLNLQGEEWEEVKAGAENDAPMVEN